MKRATRICTTALSSFPHFARSGATPFWYYLAALLPLQISASAKEKGGRQRGRAGAGRPGADKGGGGTTSCSGRAGRKRLGAAMGRRAVGLLLVSARPGPQLFLFGVYGEGRIFLLWESGVLPRAVFRLGFQQSLWELAFTSCSPRVRGSSQSAPKPGEANGAGARTGSRLCAPSGEGLGAAASLKSAAVPLCQEGGPLPGRLWVSREEKVGRAELRAGEL